MFLVSGCSFTDDEQYVDGNGLNWVKQLSNMLNEDYVNLSVGGYCNQNIFNSVYDEIILNKRSYSKIIVMWSGWERVKFYSKSVNPIAWRKNMAIWGDVYNPEYYSIPSQELSEKDKEFYINRKNKVESWQEKTDELAYSIRYYDVDDQINSTLRLQYILQQECFLRGIPLYYCQGVKEMAHIDEIRHMFKKGTLDKHKNFDRYVKQFEWYNLIERDNILEGCYRKRYGNNPKLFVPYDSHPSEYGHSLIAKDLYEFIRK
jgi:hypothetical protein